MALVCLWLGCWFPSDSGLGPEVAAEAFSQAHSPPLSLLTLSPLAAGPELQLAPASQALEKRGCGYSGLDQKACEASIPWDSLKGNGWCFKAESRDLPRCPPPSKETNHCPSLLGWPTVPICQGLRNFLKHRTFDVKTRTVLLTTQRLLGSTGDFLWDAGYFMFRCQPLLLDSELPEDRNRAWVFFPPRGTKYLLND